MGRDTSPTLQSEQESLKYHQYAETGSTVYCEYKKHGNCIFCASAVIKGDITFGIMISTQFIIGMLNGPLTQFISFIVSAQYAKISFLRMNEIKQLKDEEELLSIGTTSILPEKGILHYQISFFNIVQTHR